MVEDKGRIVWLDAAKGVAIAFIAKGVVMAGVTKGVAVAVII